MAGHVWDEKLTEVSVQDFFVLIITLLLSRILSQALVPIIYKHNCKTMPRKVNMILSVRKTNEIQGEYQPFSLSSFHYFSQYLTVTFKRIMCANRENLDFKVSKIGLNTHLVGFYPTW